MKRKSFLTIMALMLAFVMVFTACSKPETKEPAKTEETAKKEEPKAEDAAKTEDTKKEEPAKEGASGTLVTSINIGSSTGKNFDYIWWNRGKIFQILTYRGLFVANPAMTEFTPDLAKEFEVSEDKLTYTFTMKDGLKWSDGQELTAKDVAFSMSTALKVAQINGIYSSALSKIEGAAEYKAGEATEVAGIKVDGNKVEVKLSQPVGNFINILSQFAILPEHSLKDEDPLQLNNSNFWKEPVTNGMYKVTEVVTDSYIKMVPNEFFDGPQPKIAEIIVNMVSDELTAAQAGQTDFFNSKVPTEIAEMNATPGWTGHPVDTLFYYYLIFNIEGADGNTNDTLAKPEVRKALMYAIDRQGLSETLYKDIGVVTNAGVPEADAKNFNPEITKYEYSPEKAKKMLEDAGFDFEKTVEFRYYMGDQSSVDLYNAMAQNLADIGVKVNVQKFAGDPTTELFTIRKYDFALKGLAAFGYEEWYGEYASTSPTFVNIIGNAGFFDEEYGKLLQESDPAARTEILKKLQTMEQEVTLKAPIFMLKNMIYVNSDKVDIGDTQFGNPWYAYELHFENWTVK